MANQPLRGRGGTGAPRQRAVAAAARAAAKRAERTRRPTEPAEPTDSAAPTDPAGPAPTEPADPTDPADSTDPADHTQPADPTAPTAPAEEPSPQPPAAKPARSRPRPRLLTPALAVLTLLGLAATATLGWQHREAERTAEARTAAIAAARKAAPVILSYDYRHLDRDFRAARAHLTAPFLDQYSKTTKSVVAPTAKKYRGVVKATVAKPPGGDAPAVSLVSASPDRAVVLVFMNQATTSTQVSGPRLDLNRVRMTLERTPQGWKVRAVDAL